MIAGSPGRMRITPKASRETSISVGTKSSKRFTAYAPMYPSLRTGLGPRRSRSPRPVVYRERLPGYGVFPVRTTRRARWLRGGSPAVRLGREEVLDLVVHGDVVLPPVYAEPVVLPLAQDVAGLPDQRLACRRVWLPGRLVEELLYSGMLPVEPVLRAAGRDVYLVETARPSPRC